MTEISVNGKTSIYTRIVCESDRGLAYTIEF